MENKTAFCPFACHLTLDPDTASPSVTLSNGNKTVTDHQPEQRGDKGRFCNDRPQVLSKQALIGRCYWDCEVKGDGLIVGVAYENIARDEEIRDSDRSWGLVFDRRNGALRLSFWHHGVPYYPSALPVDMSTVRVYVDHEAGTVSFFNVSADQDMQIMHTYNITHNDYYTNEKLYAAIGVWSGSSVTLV